MPSAYPAVKNEMIVDRSGEDEMSKRVLVRQIRSVSGRTQPVRDTLKALGLGRIGKSQVHVVNPPIAGMIRKVSHLVDVSEAK